jgi:Tfp pilus assembly protein PilW
MKAFGRLLLATALIVPAGLVTAQSAGATPPLSATCASNTGTLTFSPGVRAVSKNSAQTITNTDGALGECTGVGITGSTGGVFNFTVGHAAVTCRTIRGKTFAGKGTIVWDANGSNGGITTRLRVNIKFNSYTSITFKGVVDSQYLRGTHLDGKATIPDTLKPVGVGGGACNNKSRVKSLAYTNDGDTKL